MLSIVKRWVQPGVSLYEYICKIWISVLIRRAKEGLQVERDGRLCLVVFNALRLAEATGQASVPCRLVTQAVDLYH